MIKMTTKKVRTKIASKILLSDNIKTCLTNFKSSTYVSNQTSKNFNLPLAFSRPNSRPIVDQYCKSLFFTPYVCLKNPRSLAEKMQMTTLKTSMNNIKYYYRTQAATARRRNLLDERQQTTNSNGKGIQRFPNQI